MKRTAIFHSKISYAKDDKRLGQFVSRASEEDSLKDLRVLLPDKEIFEDSPDLLPWAGAAATIGLVNANGFAMSPEVAVAISKTYINKAVNWGHDRNVNIGFVNAVNFSTFPDNKLISQEEALQLPIYNLVTSGILWKIAAEGLAEEVAFYDEPDTPWFHTLSLSWEVGFTFFSLIRGSRNVADSQIISDEKEIERLMPYLKCEGGDGFDPQGKEISMLITDEDAIFLALGITPRPASSVRGIVTGFKPEKTNDDKEEYSVKADQGSLSNAEKTSLITVLAKKDENNLKKDEKSENKISQTLKPNVKPIKFMNKITSTAELHERFTLAGIGTEDQASIDAYILAQTEQGAKAYTDKLEAAATALDTAKQEHTAAQVKLTAAETQISELTKKLSELDEKIEAERKQTVLAARMDDLSDKFDLSEVAVRKAIAKQIKDLDEADFVSWMKDDEVGGLILASHPKKETKASVSAEDAIKSLKETKASVTFPNLQEGEKTIDMDNLIKHFTPNIK